MTFKVSPTDVEGEKAGYGWIPKPRGWRGDCTGESEEWLIGLESVFDERRPAKEFDCGVIEENREAVVHPPATEYTERTRVGVKCKVT